MKVLLATDFSQGAAVASAWLVRVAWSAGTHVEALHLLGTQWAGLRGLLWRARTDAANGHVAAAATALSSRLGPSVSVHGSTRVGDPGAAMVERAAEIRSAQHEALRSGSLPMTDQAAGGRPVNATTCSVWESSTTAGSTIALDSVQIRADIEQRRP